jgi:hypothetical protein
MKKFFFSLFKYDHENRQPFGLECSFIKWVDLRQLVLKYPNLEHFALRRNKEINDYHVRLLVKIAPKLKLLDFRGSPGVTSRSADYLDEYCRQTGRSIVIYYDCPGGKEPQDWPQLERRLGTPIARGFDFMRNCFYKGFLNLPDFMD